MDFWLPLSITFIISLVAIKVINPIAIKTGLVDFPCARKIHTGNIPLVGGIAIYLAVLITSMLFIEYSRNLNIYLVASALVLFLGTLDDRYQLSVRVRLVAQVLVASLVIFGTEIYLHSLGYILGWAELKLAGFGIVLTVIAIIAGINAINMMDGMDGLVGLLSLVAFTALAFLLSRVTNAWSLLPVLFIAALLGYLIFNLKLHSSVTKIFMGDSGNMLIGLTLVWLMVIGIELDAPALRPVTALYIIAVPLMDMATVIMRRIKSGVSPFQADRQHLHHIFEAAGYSHRFSLIVISSGASILAALGCLAEAYAVAEWIMLVCFLLFFMCYSAMTKQAWKKLTQI
ncbi:undecaprenyl-phosphate alpha-N-acetylglucosaminyl 1-phosphate transferase [Pseudoalteromonas sp. BSi20652]|uniref:UDP-N-acetylglucosamine--undecaprenyl-phosphate N-acetylglucosaminephosphotransferase n=1 Tax=Pseudoalteromonas sp. BSi20652 TaxID=388384 RepID=UPI0002318BB2|nr:UDP-N-acetylglucosamine--undecaprenyl-phosphate N-acetylglucosaminephosphotransferase [Pseudoalteromonas sp. BSi20652]GAA59997.1 undecaprenyl-phosphate alpha-N-acetylglucosaminyl 1-phosphate transferase [Pseudoalteromonas sp. BSi20652]